MATTYERIEELRAHLRQVEAAREQLGEATYRHVKGELEATIRGLEIKDPIISARGGSVVVGKNAENTVIIAGDRNEITVGGKKLAASDAKLELLFRAYLGWLAKECGRVPLGIIDIRFAREHRVRLDEIYVELDVTSPGRPGEVEERRNWAWRLTRGEAPGRLAAREALARTEAKYHVLLGDPGSGKTTLANRLCGALAVAEDGLPKALRGLVPIRFVLREVAARHLTSEVARGTANMFWMALTDELERSLGSVVAARILPHLQERLFESGGFVVFDGLDEVPEAGGRREVLLEAVGNLVSMLAGSPTRVLVTARPYAYADPAWHLANFKILALAPFDARQIERFILSWYATAARRAFFTWSEEAVEAKREQLRTALNGRPYLADLASRPLLLTLMASLHASWGQLPEDRAHLYEETVRLLLGRWPRRQELKTSFAAVLQLEESRLRRALERLAFTVHRRQGIDPGRDVDPADITEEELLIAFRSLLEEAGPDRLLEYFADRAGLLIRRREGIYAFPHRSFQEYLAACHLGGQPDPMTRLREFAFEDPTWWREVILLGIGRARSGVGVGDAMGYLMALLPSGPEESGPVEDVHWHVAVLAGQALLEMRILGTEAAGETLNKLVIDRARRWLVKLLEEGRLSLKERAEAGDILGRLGDPRPGVGVLPSEIVGRKLPRHRREYTPYIDWREVTAGPFLMGSAESDSLAWPDEKPQHEVDLNSFWIGRHPITNAQFRPFLESDGYSNRDYWTEAGWAWLKGDEIDVSIYPEELRRQAAEYSARRSRDLRIQPFFWSDERFSTPNRPVVGVTWYEAFAYARWLEVRLASPGAAVSLPSQHSPSEPGACWRVRLPHEAQWEKAARGTDARLWPWGKEFADLGNTAESEIGEPSPVGIFRGDRSPWGTSDMAGNVWEWTTTMWSRSSFKEPDFRYPYRMDDGREKLEGLSLRVIRGGSFYDDRKLARCSARNCSDPAHFSLFVGFRLVLLAD